MSTNLPERISDLLAWADTRSKVWATAYNQIGISQAQSQAFQALAGEMKARVEAAEAIRAQSKAATMQQSDSIAAFRALAGAYIGLIKGYAESTSDPNVYALAQISPDAPRTPAPPPVPPREFVASINPSGSLTLRWKVAQPKGVYNVSYLVSRALGNVGTGSAFTFLGTASGKTFTDTTLPFGTDVVGYRITPTRGGVSGPESTTLVVQFGTAPGTVSVKRETVETSGGEGGVRLAA